MKATIIFLALFLSAPNIFSQQQIVIAGGSEMTLHAPNFDNFLPVFQGDVMDMETGRLMRNEYYFNFEKVLNESKDTMMITWTAEGKKGGSNSITQKVILDPNPKITLPESGDWELISYSDNSRPVNLQWETKFSVDHYTSLILVYKLGDRELSSWRELPKIYSKGKTLIEVVAVDKYGHIASEKVYINVIKPRKG